MTDATGETHLAVSRSSLALNVLNTTKQHFFSMKHAWRIVSEPRLPKPRLKETQLRVAHCQCRAHPHHPPMFHLREIFPHPSRQQPPIHKSRRHLRVLLTSKGHWWPRTTQMMSHFSNTLPIRGGMGQTRLPLLKLAEVRIILAFRIQIQTRTILILFWTSKKN